MKLLPEVEVLLPQITTDRRRLHQIPEMGFQEHKTAQYIKSVLDQLEIDYEDQVAGTGILALLKGKEGKKTLCFRADMDALSVLEKNQVAYQSTHEGHMHACGHDGHMAALLGLARYLAVHRDRLVHNVVLLFQPAEEGPGGARPIVAEGYLAKYGVDEIYGFHLFPNLEEGIIGVRPGAMMSQAGEVDVLVKGKSGHGAQPHQAIDSVVIGAELISGFQSIVSRAINPLQPAVLTFGRIAGGEARNIIAGSVTLEGTIRTFDQETYDTIKQKLHAFAKGMEAIHQCEIQVTIRDMYPAVVNDEDLTRALIAGLPPESVKMIDPVMLAEDFAYYQQVLPGVFFFLGCCNEDQGHTYPLHSNCFNFDERVLGYGLQAYLGLLLERGALTA